MSSSNTTDFTNPSSFILLGIPGLEAMHVWISIPFCAMYVIAILGNIYILLIVRIEPSLHEPMYYFLCMLAFTDLMLPTSTLPKMLTIFWFSSREIDFWACFTQMYFVSCFSVMESGIIVALALDRYVAICDPLRHSIIMRNSMEVKVGLAVLLWGVLFVLPLPFLATKWPFCRNNIVAHTFCECLAMEKLACANVHLSNYYLYCLTFLLNVSDVSFITFSYTQILRTIFRLPTKEAQIKTFSTCSSHLCVLLTFWIQAPFAMVSEQFGLKVSLQFQIITINVFLLLPSMLNPIIYGVSTKQIRDRLFHLFIHKGI